MLMEMMTLTGPGRLKTNSFLDTSGQKSQCPALAISHHFGAHFGDQNLVFLVKFGIIFWITFLLLFGPLLGTFWGPFWDQIGPRRVKTSPREPSRGSQSQNSAIPKTLKNHWFFNVSGVRTLPREPQEAQEGSQEAPKDLQSFNKKESKN